MAPTVSFWDTGEFIATSYILGVPHPPGSPLFLLVGKFFSLLPISSDIAFRVNIFSPIISALTISLLFLICNQFIDRVNPNDNNKFLVLNDGYRFVGNPGEYDYEITYFRDYASKLDKANSAITNQEVSSLSTAQLVSMSTSEARAELQWRLSLPVMILVVVFLGVSLSKTAPRQGRYVRVLPAILIYFMYYTALNYASRLIRFDKLPSEFNLFYVHLLFVILSLVLLFRRELKMLARLSLGAKS